MRMAEIPADLKFWLFGKGPRWHVRVSLTLDVVGLVCLVVGVLGAALGRPLGLGATNWILIAIALWLWGFWAWFAAFFSARAG
jgi:hypothetical protein